MANENAFRDENWVNTLLAVTNGGEIRRVKVSDNGHIYTIQEGTVDENNSTSTKLDADDKFIGDAIEILNCGIIFVNVYTDVASAIDGLSLQQSSDGENWDHVDNYTIIAGATKNYSVNPHAKYFRVVYTNGGDDQGAFRLQTICKVQNSKPSSHRASDPITNEDDVELGKIIVTGIDPNGIYKNVGVQLSGALRNSLEDGQTG